MDVRSVRWWRGYACTRDVRYIVLLSVERHGSEHQLSELKMHIDWHVYFCQFLQPQQHEHSGVLYLR